MTARALQRVALRMHHDPLYVAAIYDDPEGALEGEELTAAERAMLVAPDRRAWGTDPARADRVLEAIRRELPCSCAIAELAGTRRALLRFFSSDAFHAVVRDRGVAVFAMAGWLAEQGEAGRWGRVRLTSVARVEGAAARVRRGPPGEGEDVVVPDGTIELFAAISEGLATGRLPSLNRLPRLRPDGTETLRVERKPGPGAELSVSVAGP